MQKLFSFIIMLSFMLGSLTAKAGCEEAYFQEINRIQRSLDTWYGGYGFSNYYRPHYYRPTVVININTGHSSSDKKVSAAEAIILLALVAIPTTHIIIMADRMDGIDDIIGLTQNSRDFFKLGIVGNELSRMTKRIYGKDNMTTENFQTVATSVLKLDAENKFCNGQIAQDLEMRTVISGISSRKRVLARYIEVKRAIEKDLNRL